MKQTDTYLKDRQIAVVGSWAIATDGIQWILQRYFGHRWRPVSFVRSTRDILARCLREAGATPDEINGLLDSLPERFQDSTQTGSDRGSVDSKLEPVGDGPAANANPGASGSHVAKKTPGSSGSPASSIVASASSW
jgi:hypothetical protein